LPTYLKAGFAIVKEELSQQEIGSDQTAPCGKEIT